MSFFFQLEDGTWIEDEEQTLKIKANFVISAFGSTLSDSDGESLTLCMDLIVKEFKLIR